MFNNNEQIKEIRQKVDSELSKIILIILLISIIVKSTILDLPFKEFVVEFTILIISALYSIIRTFLSNYFIAKINKDNNYEKKATNQFIVGLVISSILAIFTGIANYIKYDFKIDLLPIVIILSLLVYLLCACLLIYAFSKSSTKKINK
ncbi:MAG: hypothetical protein LKF87_10295 [Clostridium tyrobutyricum]|jgi:cytochrome bd-type quinol oxidase subunit 2|uniref:DUF6773 family protein n=1 Tax=Clostridium tyrobutyricum TaxID=1519 RepID=UPI00242B9E78|nr:DUF6773 family protein [Clostridium tyrobutyricum]MCH4200119.1 hypothetical protein [Clostridium tyrobutyricum]MCH4259339.1 hypothetical protein [Clostridium tyrobutyricum]